MIRTHGVPNIVDAEAGFHPEELAKWWKDHQKADETRRKAERRAAERKNAVKRALAKLSEADKRALGVNEEEDDD